MIYYLFVIWDNVFPYFPCLVGLSSGDTPDEITAFIIVTIYLIAVSVCFHCTASLSRSAVIV